MILPIKTNYKLGYKFGDKTFYSPHHFGVDFIVPCGTPVYAPVSGNAHYFDGKQAGRAIYLKAASDGWIHRLMHLDLRLPYDGKYVSEGEYLGTVGNTGLSTACHLHWDIYNGKGLNIINFKDPLIEYKKTMPQEQKPPDFDGKEVQKLYYAFKGWKIKIAEAITEADIYKDKGLELVTKLMQSPDYTKWTEKIGNMEDDKCAKLETLKPDLFAAVNNLNDIVQKLN